MTIAYTLTAATGTTNLHSIVSANAVHINSGAVLRVHGALTLTGGNRKLTVSQGTLINDGLIDGDVEATGGQFTNNGQVLGTLFVTGDETTELVHAGTLATAILFDGSSRTNFTTTPEPGL